jgi:excinuclease ABC subunit A
LATPLKDLPQELIDIILKGSEDVIPVSVGANSWNVKTYQITFDGIIKLLEEQNERRGEEALADLENFRSLKTCPVCEGARLKKESLHFKVAGKNIYELASMDITQLATWFSEVESQLSERQLIIGKEILKEIRARISFLLDVV